MIALVTDVYVCVCILDKCMHIFEDSDFYICFDKSIHVCRCTLGTIRIAGEIVSKLSAFVKLHMFVAAFMQLSVQNSISMSLEDDAGDIMQTLTVNTLETVSLKEMNN